MECEENGDGFSAVAGRRGVKRKRRAGGARDVRLAAVLPDAPAPTRLPPSRAPVYTSPFLNVNLMEEITFWICTRRAPCLYRYNNVYKKTNEEAHCSRYRPGSQTSLVDEVPSPKKKKKKLSLLDAQSMSTESQKNVYFEKSHKQFWFSTSESEPDDGSDEDFNIRNSSHRNKSKAKGQRKHRGTLHKKNKLITSTPKPTTLRRSLRKSQQHFNNSSNINCSYNVYDATAVNGGHKPSQRENGDDKNKPGYKTHTSNSKNGTVLKEQTKNEIVANGQFEDISDVSGFTANYIRSTKLNSKSAQKSRSKSGRNLVRESQKLEQDESKIIVCINKSVNTGQPTATLNQSSDSLQNVMNLVTVNNNNNGKPLKVNRSTSQLKFLGVKDDQNKESVQDVGQVNISFQSQSSGVSRYPTRHRNNSKVKAQDLENSNQNATPAKRASRGLRELKSINQNEHSDFSLVSRTRSGKKIGVIDVMESGGSHDQMNNVHRVSSSVTKNVATPVNRGVGRKKRGTPKKAADRSPPAGKDSDSDKEPRVAGSPSPTKCVGRRATDKSRQALKKDSLRDKTGLTACFSDSEEDKPLIRRKFFC